MILNPETKIAAIIKAKPEALDAIISISPHFNKLRNPLLRKLIASRATIKMASQVGGCSVQDFFKKLQPLGFSFDASNVQTIPASTESRPSFIQHADQLKITEIDVRPIIEAGKDPFNLITGKIKQLESGGLLKLINSFEPTPLIELLTKKGFESHIEHIDENCVITYFKRKDESNPLGAEPVQPAENSDWDELLNLHKGKVEYIDVRQMEMPLPMQSILEQLDQLLPEHILFVHHKRVPIFLLTELQDRNFEYRIREISDNEVHLLIFEK